MLLLRSHTGGATDNEGLTNTLGRQPATATSHRQSGPRSTHRLMSGPRIVSQVPDQLGDHLVEVLIVSHVPHQLNQLLHLFSNKP